MNVNSSAVYVKKELEITQFRAQVDSNRLKSSFYNEIPSCVCKSCAVGRLIVRCCEVRLPTSLHLVLVN